MIVLNQNNLINVVIYFVQIVLIIIFNQLNLNAHVVLQFMEKFEVEFILVFVFRIFSNVLFLGNQPVNGTMTTDTSKHRLPGFEHDSRGTIRITYHFPNGIQDVSH
jgi:hypothetical protein